MKFDDYRISPHIKRSLTEMGFKKPTDIQFKAIKNILNGEDVLAIAQTGTGKTAAFAIPVIEMLMLNRPKGPSGKSVGALVLVPTHELAQQIAEVFQKIAKYTPLRILALFGSTEQEPQIKFLERGVDILVATPGRMFDLRAQGYIDFRLTNMLVLDEADRMLDMGFYDDIEDVIRFLPKNRQTLFFSATIDDKIKKLAYSIVKNPIRIQISPDDPVSKNIVHSVVMIEMDDKRFFLERMIKENPEQKMVVFVRTKVRADRVQAAMERAGIKSETIHSGKTHQERKTTMNRFSSAKNLVLIATDISARGVDIPNVDLVINYDLPEETENYVHRIGRTGRGTLKGKAVSFCSSEEAETLLKIEELLGYSIAQQDFSNLDYNETLMFSDAENRTFKDVMKEISEFENIQKSRKKKK
ncbi:MAG: DEAD/DEAH box helicase [Cytophagaceae bacterium]|nr:DEAD/DEAH box helicase [Cytophagaceae bacterium]MBL0301701.1 DEAD/DEAH box helicase [Cytophagaceae bacterium]MBL0324524.1 DEAD/DEAH box helicase [Cytophagaceae bacterium]